MRIATLSPSRVPAAQSAPTLAKETAVPQDSVEKGSNLPLKIFTSAAMGAVDSIFHYAVTGGSYAGAIAVDGGLGAAVGGFGGLFVAGLEGAASSYNHPNVLAYTGIGALGGFALGALHGAAITAAANLCGGGLMGAAISGAIMGACTAPIRK